ncbi:hypothetical protein GIB67_027771 [Kingdonia uniflora]|uniref:Transposase n=1 Tax=Kingdonia uniflora TaxID=39325 RepID=A0A7J7PBZ5_9MAGN|nr:hypothetical protein GIB67_027771 [Kingdonia uniflora]
MVYNEEDEGYLRQDCKGIWVKLSGGDTMDRRNSAKKMILVQIDIARKAKRVVDNLGTTNNLNSRGLRRSAQPEIVPEIVQEEHNLSPGEEATSEALNQPTHNFKRRRGLNKFREVVPITFATWHDVGNKFRDRLWTMIKQKFIVPDEARKLALMTMGKDWREHKVQKRKVIDIEDDLEQALANCPEDVPYDQWEVFAEQYTTSEYKPNQLSAQDEATLSESHKLALVSIQIALKEDVPLARGNDHLKTIIDACGSFVAWPTPFNIKE